MSSHQSGMAKFLMKRSLKIALDVAILTASLIAIAYGTHWYLMRDLKVHRAFELVGLTVADFDAELGKPISVIHYSDLPKLGTKEIVEGFSNPPLRGFHTLRCYRTGWPYIYVYFSEDGRAKSVATSWP